VCLRRLQSVVGRMIGWGAGGCVWGSDRQRGRGDGGRGQRAGVVAGGVWGKSLVGCRGSGVGAWVVLCCRVALKMTGRHVRGWGDQSLFCCCPEDCGATRANVARVAGPADECRCAVTGRGFVMAWDEAACGWWYLCPGAGSEDWALGVVVVACWRCPRSGVGWPGGVGSGGVIRAPVGVVQSKVGREGRIGGGGVEVSLPSSVGG